jgi:predicted nuclease of predicted toxin-antitoxin system
VKFIDADDAAICKYAGLQDSTIISKDEDFIFFAKQPKVRIRFIWVRLGNCRTATLLGTFETAWPQIEAAINAGDWVIEIR